MVSLARATLLHEWKRFLAAMLAVTFSGLLLLAQVALLLGLFGTVSSMIDHSSADLWVGFRNTPSVDAGRNLPPSVEDHIRMHGDVAQVEPMHFGLGEWRKPDGMKITAFLVGVSTRGGAMGYAKLLSPSLRNRLQEPDTVVIDTADTAKLGVQAGDSVEINGRTAKIIAALDGLRGIGGVNVLSSLSTSRHLAGLGAKDADAVAYHLVRLSPGANAEAVRAQLDRTGSRRTFSVWTSAGFSVLSQAYWLFESGAGTGALFSALLGMVVGMAVTSQILLSAVLASVKEYATLRALGVSIASLRKVVLEQALWVGFAGLATTFGVMGLMAPLAHRLHVALAFPWWSFPLTSALVMGVSMTSGLMALRTLSRAEPASLLR